ncbi:MAG TPA: hypothetical protein ENH12_06205 [Proteobacteria bacterium]|nr:hypothetical protein [Pseudomonadota bacterium]
MNSKISINRDNVVKSGDPLRMQVEVEKSRRGRIIAEASGLFRVPQVIEFDPDRGIAVFEKIDNLVPFQEAFIFDRAYRTAAHRLGEALSVIHRDLELPDDMVEPLPAPLAGEGGEVFLHGDFSVYNVCRDGTGGLVIIDWQMTGVHGGKATRGTPCFDMIWFINNLFYRPTLRHFHARDMLQVARSFLEGYYHSSPEAPSPAMLADYAESFFAFKRPQRKANANWRERPLLFLSHRLAWIFIRELRQEKLIS